MKKTLEKKKQEIKVSFEKGEIIRQNFNNAEYNIVQRIIKGLAVRKASVEKVFDKLTSVKKHRPTVTRTIKTKKDKKITNLEKQLEKMGIENKLLFEENQTLKKEREQRNQEIQNLREFKQCVAENSITVTDKNIKEVIEIHEITLREVLLRIKRLEKKKVVDKSFTDIEKNPGHYGFSVSQLSSGYWQAVRRVNGKPRCIYIGLDVSKAQMKIKKWLIKYYPAMLNKNAK